MGAYEVGECPTDHQQFVGSLMGGPDAFMLWAPFAVARGSSAIRETRCEALVIRCADVVIAATIGVTDDFRRRYPDDPPGRRKKAEVEDEAIRVDSTGRIPYNETDCSALECT